MNPTWPPLLMTSEPGSFARQTIVERKPQIIREVSAAYPYPTKIQDALGAFADEIAHRSIRPLHEDAPDVVGWNEEWARFEGHTWLDVPWYFAESFFYRRLMETVRFYQPGPWYDVDPFAPQKQATLQTVLPTFEQVLSRPSEDPRSTLVDMLHDALWGNRADLSNRTVTETALAGLSGRQAHRLLIDDAPHLWEYIGAEKPARIDLVHDNCGLELLLDLRLADWLLSQGWVGEIRLHLKRMPFFVSDAMIRDVEYTWAGLSAWSPAGRALVERLRRAVVDGRLRLCDDPFWSLCFSFRHIPPSLQSDLAAAQLVLLKGDVNYRRLLDDRHWPPTARMADIAADFPTSFAALRTLKGELIVDLQPGQAEELAAADPTWMINGKRGVIQWVRH